MRSRLIALIDEILVEAEVSEPSSSDSSSSASDYDGSHVGQEDSAGESPPGRVESHSSGSPDSDSDFSDSYLYELFRESHL